jgi:hypothetical protein
MSLKKVYKVVALREFANMYNASGSRIDNVTNNINRFFGKINVSKAICICFKKTLC